MKPAHPEVGGERAIPNGYVAVPVDPNEQRALLRLCVLFRPEPDGAGGHFVVVRDMLTGRALLGCLVDVGGVVHDWIEIWVQDSSGLTGSPAEIRESLSNAAFDRQWKEDVKASQELDAGQIVHTGWEERHPLPTFVHRKQHVPVHPRDRKSGHAFRLCEDDGLLASKDLPVFSSTLHRYLYISELGDASPFVPLSPDAPRNESTADLKDLVDEVKNLVPLNPGGGLIQARKFSAIRLEPYIDVLGGATWDGVFHGTTQVALSETLRGLSQASTLQRLAEGHLVLGRGDQGRLIEVFHLKLRLLADAVVAAQTFVRTTQRPMLNITAESFQVRLEGAGCGLPLLWTARLVLANPGDAVPLPIEGSDLTYHLPGRGAQASIFRPASGRVSACGHALLRIRKIVPEAKGAIVAEGTLDTHESLRLAAHDLVWLRVRSASGAVNLYVHIDAKQAMAAGEVRFRSVPQRFGESLIAELRALEGVPVDRVPFEVVPLLSSPCDLYALGVLAVRACFAHPQLSLAVALDEVLSLARQIAVDYQEGVSLPLRVRGIVEGDERWVESLGPHRLVREEMSPSEALSFIPPELWFGTLAMILRMFPGIGPDSICCDLGDARPGGLHKVFDPVIDDLEQLLVRSRSLIVVDWAASREIHRVIRQHALQLAEVPAAAE